MFDYVSISKNQCKTNNQSSFLFPLLSNCVYGNIIKGQGWKAVGLQIQDLTKEGYGIADLGSEGKGGGMWGRG